MFGQNWQGKSSVVDAIGFALFGVDIFPKKVAGTAVSSDHLINEDSHQGSVELQFEIDGCEYTLHRSLPKREVVLRKRGEEIAVGVRTVGEKLIALLGIDVRSFQNIFFADQDELRRSLDSSPEERRMFIERLLGVEEWKERIECLRAARKALDGLLGDLTAGRLGAFLTHMEELAQDLSAKEETIRQLQSTIHELKAQAPKSLRTLRSAESGSESKIATLQHQQLAGETRLAIAEKLRDGVQTGKCPTCTQSIPSKLKASRLVILRRSIQVMRSQLLGIKKSLDRAHETFFEAGYDASYQAFVTLQETKARFDAISEETLADERRLRRLRNQAKTFGKKPEQVERTKSEIAFLVNLENAIQMFRKSLRNRLVGHLALSTNDLLARFHDGDNDTTVKIDDDLNIAVQLHGREVPIFNLSGAAKDILALALRYGLLKVAARGVGFLVLDEPTRHMDPLNCQRLKAIFNDLLDRQLIVVTVNSEFWDARGRHFRVAKDQAFHSALAESW